MLNDLYIDKNGSHWRSLPTSILLASVIVLLKRSWLLVRDLKTNTSKTGLICAADRRLGDMQIDVCRSC